jgi:tetratricopeptide (TPR) repeat protein
LTELGHGDAEIRRGAQEVPAAALGEELAAYATGQAERFDARNGTSARSERIAWLLRAEPYEQALPLSPTARRAAPRPAPAPGAAPEVPDADAGTLIRLAEEHEREDRDAEVAAVLAVFDKRFPDIEALEADVAARRMMLLGAERWTTAGTPESAISAWERGVELFEAAGDAIQASEARGRLGMVRCVLGDAETGMPLVEQDLAIQEEHGDAVFLARARARFAMALVTHGRYEEGVAAQERALAAASQAGDARMVARNLSRKARYLVALHRHDEAEAATAEAVAFYRQHGPAAQLALANLLYAQIAHDPEKVVAACTEVLDHGDPAYAMEARSARGYALLRLNRPAEAVPDFVEWVAICAEQGNDDAGAFARLELARAYQGAGRSAEAAEVAEEAIIWLDRGGHTQAADDARLLSAATYRTLGLTDEALARYAELVERLADNPAGRGQIQEYAADLLFRTDRDAEAAERFRLAAADLRAAEDPLGEVRALRRRVLALRWAGEPEAALETAELARERHADLAEEPAVIWERAMLGYETAMVLTGSGNEAEALPHLDGVAEKLRGIGATGNADEAEFLQGQVLMRAGRPAEAEVLLRRLLDGLAEDDDIREPVAEALADVLDELGRTDESANLRRD